jgi:hypothetical protein
MLAPVEEIFCDIDDFCKYFLREQSDHILPNPSRQRDRESQMSLSEVATIIVLFQMSHYRTFKDYYEQCILQDIRSYFPRALSYTRFVRFLKILRHVVKAQWVGFMALNCILSSITKVN